MDNEKDVGQYTAKRKRYYCGYIDPASPAFNIAKDETYANDCVEVGDDEDDNFNIPKSKANLVGSMTDAGTHMPVIDIDGIPVWARPSSTPGNYHLYIDKEVSWEDYELLLKALYVCGIIEKGYLEASLAKKMTHVRLPWVKKNVAQVSYY